MSRTRPNIMPPGARPRPTTARRRPLVATDRSGYPGSQAATESPPPNPSQGTPAGNKSGRGAAAAAHGGADPHGAQRRRVTGPATVFDYTPCPVSEPEPWERTAVNLSQLKATDPAAANRGWREFKARCDDPDHARWLIGELQTRLRAAFHVPAEYLTDE